MIDLEELMELCREYAGVGYMCGLDVANFENSKLKPEDCWKQYDEVEAKIRALFESSPSPAELNTMDCKGG